MIYHPHRDTDTDTAQHPRCACEDHCDLLADGLRDGRPLSSAHAVEKYGVRLTPGEVLALTLRIKRYGV